MIGFENLAAVLVTYAQMFIACTAIALTGSERPGTIKYWLAHFSGPSNRFINGIQTRNSPNKQILPCSGSPDVQHYEKQEDQREQQPKPTGVPILRSPIRVVAAPKSYFFVRHISSFFSRDPTSSFERATSSIWISRSTLSRFCNKLL
jgi:hypothetical protein